MRYSPERSIKDTEFKAALIVGGIEIARMAGQIWRLQALSTGTSFDSINPAVNFILDYTGDFAGTYLMSWLGRDSTYLWNPENRRSVCSRRGNFSLQRIELVS